MGKTLNCESIKTFYTSIYEVAKQAKERQLVFYGAGFWGEVAVKIFELFQVTPVAFCDDDFSKIGTSKKVKGKDKEILIPIISITDAIQLYPNAIYVATVNNVGGETSLRYKLNKRLKELGVLTVYSGFHPSRYTFLLEVGLEFDKYECDTSLFQSNDIEGIIVMNHMGNSGSVYFNTLVDNHPSILNITFLGGQTRLETLYEKRFKYLQEEELVIEIASQLEPYFLPCIPFECFNSANKVAEKFFLTKDGKPERKIYINSKKFVEYLAREILSRGKLSYGQILKAIYVAYANCIGKKKIIGEKYYMFYDMHDINTKINKISYLFTKDNFIKIYFLYIIREPVQQVYSWLKRSVVNANPDERYYMLFNEFIKHFMSGTGKMLEDTMIYKNNEVRVIKFEDLKSDNRNTLERFCKWIGIKYSQTLEDTTFNGEKVYFPRNTLSAGVITGNNAEAILAKDYSDLLSEYDIFRLKILYGAMYKHYYSEKKIKHHTIYSKIKMQKMLKKPFRFEKVIEDELIKDSQIRMYDYGKIEYQKCIRKLENFQWNTTKRKYYELI